MTDETLRSMVERVFTEKPCDNRSPIVIAAIITAAMRMSAFSSSVSEDDVLNELLDAYDVNGNYGVLNFIGMDDSSVEKTIGYQMDMTTAPQEYLSNKDMYDTMYLAIKIRKMDKQEQAKTIGLK